MNMVFFGRVLAPGGLLVLDKPKDYAKHVRSFAGKHVEVLVKQRRQKRSQDQNAWLWGVAYKVLGDEWGYDKHEREQLHYALVNKCFGVRRDERLNEDVPNVRSSKLDTKQFSEYMEWLVRFAAVEFGIVIPLPNEVDLSALTEVA